MRTLIFFIKNCLSLFFVRYPYFHVLSSICAWLNACINPFIYFALNPRYRNAFKKLFRIRSSYNINGGGGVGGGSVGGGGGGGQNAIGAELSTLSNENSRSVKWTSSRRASSSNHISGYNSSNNNNNNNNGNNS